MRHTPEAPSGPTDRDRALRDLYQDVPVRYLPHSSTYLSPSLHVPYRARFTSDIRHLVLRFVSYRSLGPSGVCVLDSWLYPCL